MIEQQMAAIPSRRLLPVSRSRKEDRVAYAGCRGQGETQWENRTSLTPCAVSVKEITITCLYLRATRRLPLRLLDLRTFPVFKRLLNYDNRLLVIKFRKGYFFRNVTVTIQARNFRRLAKGAAINRSEPVNGCSDIGMTRPTLPGFALDVDGLQADLAPKKVVLRSGGEISPDDYRISSPEYGHISRTCFFACASRPDTSPASPSSAPRNATSLPISTSTSSSHHQ